MTDANQAFRKRTRLAVWLGTACVLAGLNSAQAHAHTHLSSAAFGAISGCASQLVPPLPLARAGLEGAKSSAILGGQPSALDLISAQQAGEVTSSLSYSAEQAQPTDMGKMLLCPLGAMTRTTALEPLPNKAQPSADFLGSSRIVIGSTPLDRAWQRVSRKSASVSAIDYLAKEPQETDFAYVAKVNAWVNENVRFVEDTALYGRSDYWATAAETLRLLKGDCEDFAILKYQLLANSGVDPSSLYLTLVWDAIRRRDHAVLIVQIDGLHYLLDNESDQVLLADASHEYAARMSFSGKSSWLHGYTARPDAPQMPTITRVAYFSDKAVSKALATGFSR